MLLGGCIGIEREKSKGPAGFLGTGTILVKEHDHITGLTTAAGLWTTATIGITCGYGFYVGAMFGTLVVAVTVAILFKFEARGRKKNRKRMIYMEVQGTSHLNEYRDCLVQEWQAKHVMVVPPRTAMDGNVGLEIVLLMGGNEDVKTVLEKLRSREGVLFVYESIKREI